MDADTLDQAVAAIRTRGYYSAFPESPSPRIYGADAAAEGQRAFEAWQGRTFPVSTPGSDGDVATERSPFGIPLDVRYPKVDAAGLDDLLTAARAGMARWRDAGPDTRVEVTLEILRRLHLRVFELANAVMATTGQAFVMAFQAGGTHALDRALEAVAYAHTEMTRHPATMVWERPAKGDPVRVEKTFTVVPRGVAVVIGCTTFPTWNSYPGLFASLVTGNPVVVKPHPRAVLPLAVTVQACQEVLADRGFDPHLVTLAAEAEGAGLARDLATRPEVRIVDFTGSGEFGGWLESHATQALVFTEKSGVNPVVIDSTDSFRGLVANLAFTLSLYSGQMCTTSQNIYVPAGGIETDEGHKSFADVGAGLAAAVDKLLADEARAVELLGAIVNDDVLGRVDQAADLGELVLEPRALTHPTHPDAVVRTPAIVAVDAGTPEGACDRPYARECFGPVTFLVRTADTSESLELVRRLGHERGAMTAAVYSTSEPVLDAAREVALDVGVALSENLTGGVYVNQSAAFSDYHGTGANPAANAAYVDAAYVTGRFRIVQSRRPAPA
ncbi:phenylacetic acid degradation protein paaN [Actinopolymorpha cephalotaxi]|uniref:Phenylacetic acid degradation protein paaN n=1 Tax=Actinopolymorpha cephalotaxi TaxID=504797 RepID=A0A1I3BHJ0_9ACTN|nr:phenylacetic acid degradation protein PaaN [Actinopolymorpha cephalotaxi]NYH86390.1 phenylacetic acid degradation protein paaN [Actinopolymorpha cephalotaxi]SFH61732.1 phenylacetic acid degradation protein paaN [Actinopolymorpha cephalotaxi]